MNIVMHSVDQPDLQPLVLNGRIKHQLPYLTVDCPEQEQTKQSANEYCVNLGLAEKILDEGSFLVVSPLRAENAAEVELSEEAEQLLEWITANQILRIRVSE